jgi:hypothetical protein
MIAKGIVRDFGKLISEAERRIIEGIKDGRIETETSITDRFLNEIERTFDEYRERENDVRFRARTLRDRGRNAPEYEFGADFCGVLDIHFRFFRQSKGFLSQAKREGYGISIQRGFFGATTVGFSKNNEFQRLNKQVEKMLSITPDSFVIVYDIKGFVVVPASSIKGLNGNSRLYGKTVDRFFKEFLMCFIGDPRLKAYDDKSLERMKEETNARTAIIFQLHEEQYLQ